MSSLFKEYYQLTKPGIIYGNVLTATGGFLLAAKGSIDWLLLASVLAGTSLIIASACAINNYIDRDIDRKMARTQKRALASNRITGKNAIMFATVLGLAGFLVLALGTNATTVAVGAVGFIDYLVFYTIWKRRSAWGTAVGSIAGATPVAAGYTAVTGVFDLGALLLFLILVCWQMPHFYSIAIYRFKDYKAAGLPVLPVKKGPLLAKIHIAAYICAFLVAVLLLTLFGFTGYVYLAVLMLLGFAWLHLAIKGFRVHDNTAWARRMFLYSLVIILSFSLTISFDNWLP